MLQSNFDALLDSQYNANTLIFKRLLAFADLTLIIEKKKKKKKKHRIPNSIQTSYFWALTDFN